MEINESIKLYTNNSSECQIMKILIDPINYLEGLNKSNYFSISNKFIKDKETLKKYIMHIRNILIQGYINYYSNTSNIPKTLYRSISKSELEFIKKNGVIDSFLSTCKTLDTAISYTMEVSNYEWEPQEHFILKFNTENHPFIDVDKIGARSFEPNEVILTAPCSLSNLKLVRPGGMVMGFYLPETIPIYKASFKSNHSPIQVSEQELITNYELLESNIETYGKLIEEFLNQKTTAITSKREYINWCKNASNFFKLYSNYLSNNISHNLSTSETINTDIVTKKLK